MKNKTLQILDTAQRVVFIVMIFIFLAELILLHKDINKIPFNIAIVTLILVYVVMRLVMSNSLKNKEKRKI